MAKKHFGKFMAFAAIAGAAAAGISYFLRYKSFHKELDEDFHDFEDDFDEDLKEFGDTQEAGKTLARNYVPLGTDRQASGQGFDTSADDEPEPDVEEEAPGDTAGMEEPDVDHAQAGEMADSGAGTTETPLQASAVQDSGTSETNAAAEKQEESPESSEQTAEPDVQKTILSKPEQPEPATTIIEDTTD